MKMHGGMEIYIHAFLTEAHPASYIMDTSGSFPVGKAARSRSWPLTSI